MFATLCCAAGCSIAMFATRYCGALLQWLLPSVMPLVALLLCLLLAIAPLYCNGCYPLLCRWLLYCNGCYPLLCRWLLYCNGCYPLLCRSVAVTDLGVPLGDFCDCSGLELVFLLLIFLGFIILSNVLLRLAKVDGQANAMHVSADQKSGAWLMQLPPVYCPLCTVHLVSFSISSFFRLAMLIHECVSFSVPNPNSALDGIHVAKALPKYCYRF